MAAAHKAPVGAIKIDSQEQEWEAVKKILAAEQGALLAAALTLVARVVRLESNGKLTGRAATLAGYRLLAMALDASRDEGAKLQEALNDLIAGH